MEVDSGKPFRVAAKVVGVLFVAVLIAHVICFFHLTLPNTLGAYGMTVDKSKIRPHGFMRFGGDVSAKGGAFGDDPIVISDYRESLAFNGSEVVAKISGIFEGRSSHLISAYDFRSIPPFLADWLGSLSIHGTFDGQVKNPFDREVATGFFRGGLKLTPFDEGPESLAGMLTYNLRFSDGMVFLEDSVFDAKFMKVQMTGEVELVEPVSGSPLDFTLKMHVDPEYVFLTSLFFDTEGTEVKVRGTLSAPSLSAPVKDDGQAAETPNLAKTVDVASLVAAAKARGDEIQEIKVSQAELKELIGEGYSVGLMSARIVPSVKNSEMTGFKIFGVIPNGFFKKLGFENGDVVVSIQGEDMKAPERGFAIFEAFDAGGDAVISIDRVGVMRTHHIIVSP